MWLQIALATCKALKYVQQLDKSVHIIKVQRLLKYTCYTMAERNNGDAYIGDGNSASIT